MMAIGKPSALALAQRKQATLGIGQRVNLALT
jgi:hypothetical protein